MNRSRFALIVPLLGLLIVLSVPGPALAASVSDLYAAQVPVPDQSADARDAALKRALREVLVKVTGRREAPHGEAAAELLEAPSRYLQRYRYRTDSAADDGEGDDASGLALWVSFDRDVIERRLRQLGLPVWGETRPSVLVWLALQDADDRYIVGADTPERVRTLIEEPARERGVPMLTPLMDVEDRRRVGFSDVWGGFLEDVRAASERYEPHILLVGRIDEGGAAASGRWWLVEGDEVGTWEVRGAEVGQAIAAGVHGAADRLAARYAVADSDEGAQSLVVEVSRVGDLDGYLRASDYLASLSPVSEISSIRVDPERVRFRLRVRGGSRALERALTLGDTLAAAGSRPDGAAGSGDAVDQRYRLLP